MQSSGIALTETWCLAGDELVWEMIFTNTNRDLQLYFTMNQAYAEDTITTYTQRLARHNFCSLDGSFAYWTRPNGIGPMLTMVPAAVYQHGGHVYCKSFVCVRRGNFEETLPAREFRSAMKVLCVC